MVSFCYALMIVAASTDAESSIRLGKYMADTKHIIFLMRLYLYIYLWQRDADACARMLSLNLSL